MESAKRSTCIVFFILLGSQVGRILCSTSGTEGEPAYGTRLCDFSRYPDLCRGTVQGLGDRPFVLHELASVFVEKARDELELHVVNVSTNYPIHQTAKFEDQHARRAGLGHCLELMDMSLKRLNQSLAALRSFPSQSKPDIQAWLSASLTFQEACKDSIGDSLSDTLTSLTSLKIDHVSKLISNALALANRIANHIDHGFVPEWIKHNERRLLQAASEIHADAVVAQDGTGNYKTLSEAIRAAPGRGRFVIHVKAGVYEEKIDTNKDGIMLVGDGKYSTIITGSDSVGAGFSLSSSSTFAVSGDGFIARDIAFHNTAGPRQGQAVALWVSSDRSVLYRCTIAGYQDTLYAFALRQFYRECDIYGTIDFIFGNAAAVFQSCNLVLRRPQAGAYDVILANGRSDPGQATGFSIHKCTIVTESSAGQAVVSYLGRPWKEFSRSVVMQTSIDSAIATRGWIEWEGKFGLDTLYFAEYFNSGAGAATFGRVKWAGYHVIGSEEAAEFTVGRFIAGSSWLPSTGAAFQTGLG